MAIRFLQRMPVMVVPNGFSGQPIDAGEVAGRLVELTLSDPSGRVPNIGGPEVRTVADVVRGYLEVTGEAKEDTGVSVAQQDSSSVPRGGVDGPEQQVRRDPLGGVLARECSSRMALTNGCDKRAWIRQVETER
jgi:uncharacterized protein YbjT (DUF2867 family)